MNWISVNERLPELHEHDDGYIESVFVLVFAEGNYYVAWRGEDFVTEDNKAGWYWNNNDMFKYDHLVVTHWMPLPEPPTESGE